MSRSYADIRQYMKCPLGDIISGSWSRSSIVGAGVVSTSGTMILNGSAVHREGTTFNFSLYDPTRNSVRQLDPAFLVISSTYNPADNTTTILFGDTVAFYSEYETDLVKITAVPGDTGDEESDELFNDPNLSDIAKQALIPALNSSVITGRLLRSVGLTGPTIGSFTFYRRTFDISGSILGMLGDFAISDNYAYYSTRARDLNLTSLNLGYSGSYVRISEADVIDYRPSGSPIRGASKVKASYVTKKIDDELLKAVQDAEDPPEDDDDPDNPDAGNPLFDPPTAYCYKTNNKSEQGISVWTYTIPANYSGTLTNEEYQIDYEEDIKVDTTVETCVDTGGNVVYTDERSVSSLYGESSSTQWTKTQRYIAGYGPIQFLECQQENENRISLSYREWRQAMLDAALDSAETADEQALQKLQEEADALAEETGEPAAPVVLPPEYSEVAKYRQDQYKYTFGIPQSSAQENDPIWFNIVPDIFKVTTVRSVNIQREPLVNLMESIGLPYQCYGRMPSNAVNMTIPPVMRKAWGISQVFPTQPDQQVINRLLAETLFQELDKSTEVPGSSYVTGTAYTVSYESVYESSSYEIRYVPSIQTAQGGRKVQKYLQSATISPDGEPYTEEEMYDLPWSLIADTAVRLGTKRSVDSETWSYQVNSLATREITEALNVKFAGQATITNASVSLENIKDEKDSISQTLGEETNVVSVAGTGGSGILFNYTPPYSSDDKVVKTGEGPDGKPLFGVKKGQAEGQASAFASTQNKLRLSKARGVTITVPMSYYSSRPLVGYTYSLSTPNYSVLIAGAADSQNVTFDSSGTLLTMDLLISGVA